MAQNRPMPPQELIDLGGVNSAPDVVEWMRETFLDESSPLYNADHIHLRDAVIGVLWQGQELVKHGRQTLGRCELVQLTGDAWSAARKQMQLLGWFGLVPDFIISLDAAWAAAASDVEWCALIEHEMSHAGQESDEYGAPKFGSDGRPKWAIKSHDVECFLGVAARYGAVEPGVKELVKALSLAPIVSGESIALGCGTCAMRRAA